MNEEKWFDVIQTIEKHGTIKYYYEIALSLITAYQNEHMKTKTQAEQNTEEFKIGDVKGIMFKHKTLFQVELTIDHGFDFEYIVFKIEAKFSKSKGVYSIKEIIDSGVIHRLHYISVSYYQGYIYPYDKTHCRRSVELREYKGDWLDKEEGTKFSGDSILNKTNPEARHINTCMEEVTLTYLPWKLPVFFHLHEIGKLDEFLEAPDQRKFEIIRENSKLITYKQLSELKNWPISEKKERILRLDVLPSKYTKYLIDEFHIKKFHFHSMEDGNVIFSAFDGKFGTGIVRLTVPIEKLKGIKVTLYENSANLIELGELEFIQEFYRNNELKES